MNKQRHQLIAYVAASVMLVAALSGVLLVCLKVPNPWMPFQIAGLALAVLMINAVIYSFKWPEEID